MTKEAERELAQKVFDRMDFDGKVKAAKTLVSMEIAIKKVDPLKEQAFRVGLADLLSKTCSEAQEADDNPIPMIASLLENLLSQSATLIGMLGSFAPFMIRENLTMEGKDLDLLQLELQEHFLVIAKEALVQHSKEAYLKTVGQNLTTTREAK